MHLERVEEGLAKLQLLRGQLNVTKCHIGGSQVVLLGHVISIWGIEVDPSKAQALVEMAAPTNGRQLVSFLRKVRYLGRFIHFLSKLVAPLQSLANADTFAWEEDHQICYKEVKGVLTTFSTISPPKWDTYFFVNPSAGDSFVGVVLMQKDEETLFMRPVYFAKTLCKIEKGYTDVEQVTFALIFYDKEV